MKRNVFEPITASIIESLEKGVKPWVKPWDSEADMRPPVNALTGHRYTGVNFIMLLMAQLEKQWQSNQWITFKQAKELAETMQVEAESHEYMGVRKGARSMKAFMPIWVKDKELEDKEGDEQTKLCFKPYSLFNLDQTTGLKTCDDPKWIPNLSVEAFIEQLAEIVPLQHEGGHAYYRRSCEGAPEGEIVLPERTAFDRPETYYATLFHEAIHATGEVNRLNREKGALFGDDAYAFEELVAELGALMLGSLFGYTGDHIDQDQHASYISGWLSILNKDTSAISKAAVQAEAAVSYLMERCDAVNMAA